MPTGLFLYTIFFHIRGQASWAALPVESTTQKVFTVSTGFSFQFTLASGPRPPIFSIFSPLVPHNQLLISSGRCRRDSTSLSLLIIKRAYLVITLITLWIYHIFGLKVLQVLVGSESQHRSDSFPDFVVDVAGAGLVTGIAAPVPQLSHRDDKVLEVWLSVDLLDPVLDDLDMPAMTWSMIYCWPLDCSTTLCYFPRT